MTRRRPGRPLAHSTDDMRRLAAERGGEFMSAEFISTNRLHRWRCGVGHEWDATPSNVMRGRWCGACFNIQRKERGGFTIEAMRRLAGDRGGACLSDRYLNAHSLLRWRCAAGHEWHASPNNIRRGNWCRTCSKGGSSLGERMCRAVLELMFGAAFPKMRPGWLNRGQRVGLELDGYAESLNVAFEYNGLQHYEAGRSGFAWDAEDHAEIQARDRDKARLCAEQGVKLIVVPHFTDPLNLSGCIDQIEHAVLWAGLTIPKGWRRPKEIPSLWAPLDRVFGPENARRLQTIAAEKGGALLSEAVTRAVDPLLWRCAHGHEWRTRGIHVLKGRWCQRCHYRSLKARRAALRTVAP